MIVMEYYIQTYTCTDITHILHIYYCNSNILPGSEIIRVYDWLSVGVSFPKLHARIISWWRLHKLINVPLSKRDKLSIHIMDSDVIWIKMTSSWYYISQQKKSDILCTCQWHPPFPHPWVGWGNSGDLTEYHVKNPSPGALPDVNTPVYRQESIGDLT